MAGDGGGVAVALLLDHLGIVGDGAHLQLHVGEVGREARAALLQAAQRQSGADPARQRTLLQLGAVCARSGRHAEAAEAYRDGLAAGGDEPSASWNLALSLKQLGRLEEAVQHFADATEQQAPAGEPPTA